MPITSFFGGSFFGGEFFNAPSGQTPPPPPVEVPAGRKRKRERYAAQIEGKWRFFDSIDELEGYLASLREEKLEKVEKRARKVYDGVVIRTGEVPKTPKIVVSRAPQEVREAVSRANEQLAAQYMQILLELREQDDEEDDLLLL